MLADEFQAEMRMGGKEGEAAAIKLLDSLLQLSTGRHAPSARLVIKRKFEHSVQRPSPRHRRRARSQIDADRRFPSLGGFSSRST